MKKQVKVRLPSHLSKVIQTRGKVTGKKNGSRKKESAGKRKSNTLQRKAEEFKKKLKRIHWSKVIQKSIPYVVFGYFGDMIGCAYRMSDAPDFFNKLMGALGNLGTVFETVIISFHPFDLLFGIVFGAGMRAVVYYKGKNAKKFRKGEEYGSARWGTEKDIEPYMDMDHPENNVILTKTEGLLMNGRPKSPKYARNKNILVIGGSGSGKTRFFVKPNLMQLHSSYVVTDPKGEIITSCGKALEKNRYQVKVFNTINFKKSMHYNPFEYIHSEKDILKLVTTLIANTKGDGKAGDEFWTKAETLLYMALIGYIHYEAPQEEKNFATLLEMINACGVREDDEDYENHVDILFNNLEKKDPNHFAVREYRRFKLAAGIAAKSCSLY